MSSQYRDFSFNPVTRTYNRTCARIPLDDYWQSQCYVPLMASDFTEELESRVRRCCDGELIIEQNPVCGYNCVSNRTLDENNQRGDLKWSTCIMAANITGLRRERNETGFAPHWKCWGRPVPKNSAAHSDLIGFKSGSGLMTAITVSLLISSLAFQLGFL